MRIAVVHSFYRSGMPSGENDIVHSQVDCLTRAGHDVRLFRRDTDLLETQPGYKARSAARVLSGYGSNPRAEIMRFKPDVVHVHNLFPNFGDRWVSHFSDRVVTTIHNFRPVCANGLLFRDGIQCTDCIDDSWRAAIKHSCYQNSRLSTLPLALRNARGLRGNPLLSASRRVIVLNARAAEIFYGLGVAREKMIVLPNGLKSPSSSASPRLSSRWLVAGRLSMEKGILELLQQWPQNEILDVVGSGPLQSQVNELARGPIEYLGQVTHDILMSNIASYRGVVIPSRCFEMQPTIALEALAAGVPVVALRANAAAQLVEDSGAGLVYANGSELLNSLSEIAKRREEFSKAALNAFQESFSEETWLRQIEELYRSIATCNE